MILIEVIKQHFGEFKGETVWQWTLTNDHGMKMSVLNFGAIVTSIETADKFGEFANISLGFSNLDDYLAFSPYFGAVVGPVAGRITKGQFELEGEQFQLSINDGNNSLHGGKANFSKRMWDVAIEEQPDQIIMKFQYQWPDGENGYPGKIETKMSYILNNKNEWLIDYEAETEKPTIYNPSNHIYFNLTGDNGSTVLEHQLKVNSEQYVPLDGETLPIGEIWSVKDSVFDLREETKIAEIVSSSDEQIKIVGAGLDHAFILKHEKEQPDAILVDPKSGRCVEMETTSDAVVIYTANSLASKFNIAGVPIPKYAGITMETQGLVDAINQPGFGDIVLRPAEKFVARTTFRFTVDGRDK